MVYVKPMDAITQNELQAVGYRAQDLALLHQNQLQIASSFVVLSTALEETIRNANLKYKLDYVMSHAQPQIQSSLQNVYSSARKALAEAKLPAGFEVELKSSYETITQPLAVGELVAERPAVRIIMSLNRLDDPENNDSIIQNVSSFEELLVGVREAWALAWHPSLLGPRLNEHFPENRLKVALIIQAMDEPVATTHTYSSLPQDHKKTYLQVYLGYPDLREKVTKDYYAISKDMLRIVATQVKQQPTSLQRNANKELALLPLAPRSGDKMIDRDLIEIARLTKKAERLLQQPIKAFFVSTNEMHELLFVNRLGFDIILGNEAETPIQDDRVQIEPIQQAPAAQIVQPEPAAPDIVTALPVATPTADDFIVAETESPSAQVEQKVGGVAAKLLKASLRIVHQVVERKYRSTFAETDMTSNLSDMINRLNSASVFSRPVDGALLLQAEEAAKQESMISEAEYAKAIEEVAFLMTYA